MKQSFTQFFKKFGLVAVGICLYLPSTTIFTLPTFETKIKSYDISFPIAELGGCANLAECTAYCNDPVNSATCIRFAKSKGFYNDNPIEKLNILAAAKRELICDSEETCYARCEKAENYALCQAFGNKHGLVAEKTDVLKQNLVQKKAKEILGCNSFQTCRAYCNEKDHQEQCSTFAEHVGLEGGFTVSGPGGCKSPESCSIYCGEPSRAKECSTFSLVRESFLGPGGCNSEQSCRTYCETHSDECRTHQEELNARYCEGSHNWDGYACRERREVNTDWKQTCEQTPGCTWTGTSCQCQETSEPAQRCIQYPGCNWTGTICQCSSSQSFAYDQETICRQTTGCSWTGTTCQCYTSGSGSSGSSLPSTSCQSDQNWNGTSCVSQVTTSCQEPSGGCGSGKYWDLGSCSCRSAEDMCKKTSGCSWTGTTCQCSETSSGNSGLLSPTPTTPNQTPTSGSSSTSCSGDTYWNGTGCVSPTSSSCQEPSGGCGGGTYWDSGSCSCKSAEDMCKQTSGCSWSNNTCNCSSVHGETTDIIANKSSKTPEETIQTYDIRFPIPELGNCTDCGSCNAFCGSDENKTTCRSYAASHGLPQKNELPQEILTLAKKELGCGSESACRKYCENPQNEKLCRDFAVKHSLDATSDVPLPPKIKTDISSPISGTFHLEFQGRGGAFIELYLQSKLHPEELLLLTRIPVDTNGLATYEWESAHVPNGEYKLIAKTVVEKTSSPTVSFISLVVENPQTQEGVDGSKESIIFPSRFDPKEIPADPKTSVQKIENTKHPDGVTTLTLQGKAPPHALVNLLIFSNPIVVTVRADANGVWRYDLEKPLEPGKHTAYAAISLSDGSKIRSEVADFVIAPVSAADTTSENLVLASASTDRQYGQYITIVAGLIAAGIATLIMLLWLRSRQPELSTSKRITTEDSHETTPKS